MDILFYYYYIYRHYIKKLDKINVTNNLMLSHQLYLLNIIITNKPVCLVSTSKTVDTEPDL